MPDQQLRFPRLALLRLPEKTQLHLPDLGKRLRVIGARRRRAAARGFDKAMGLVKSAILGFLDGVHIKCI